MSVAHLTQRLLLVLTICNLLGSRHLVFLKRPSFSVLLALFFLFLDRGLPFLDGIILIDMLHWHHGL
jgi:hypothetical protein